MSLVTVEDARMHLRVDSMDDDPWFATWIPAVESAVFTWLKDAWRAYEPSGDIDSAGNPIPAEDSNGDPIPRFAVKAAVLVELAQQYRYRDGSDAGAVPSHWGYGFVLGAGATSLLSGLRKSTVR